MADPTVAPGDGWVDGKGSFEAEVSANAVYKLMGQGPGQRRLSAIADPGGWRRHGLPPA